MWPSDRLWVVRPTGVICGLLTWCVAWRGRLLEGTGNEAKGLHGPLRGIVAVVAQPTRGQGDEATTRALCGMAGYWLIAWLIERHCGLFWGHNTYWKVHGLFAKDMGYWHTCSLWYMEGQSTYSQGNWQVAWPIHVHVSWALGWLLGLNGLMMWQAGDLAY